MKKKLAWLTALELAMMNVAVVFASAAEITGGMTETEVDAKPIIDVGGQIFGAIRVIGIIIAVIMVAYVGIKYLTAGAGTKAEVKSNLVPMLAGAALIALAPTLVGWAFGVFGA